MEEKWPGLISCGSILDPMQQQHVKSAKCKERMQDVSNQGSSKMKPKRARGETIEMHGGRIVRSTGRKDRHSKVCTARGPRDRRVRLSPNTAIQFYDVQDRLGYDRPSKALDWLMKEAQSAIDALDDSRTATDLEATILMQQKDNLSKKVLVGKEERNCSKSACGNDSQDFLNDTSMNEFSFFSMDNGAVPPSSTDFQTYSHGDLSTSRTKIQTHQDFSLLFSSGQQDPSPASTPISHYATNSEIAICERILGWNFDSSNPNESQESLINSLSLHFPSHFDQNQLLFHREPLQSSFSAATRASLDNQFPNLSFSGNSFSTDDGLSELSAAARIQGQEEQNPISSNPSSATSLLHYQDWMD